MVELCQSLGGIEEMLEVKIAECEVWIMEDYHIGVRAWLQLMCCALVPSPENTVALNFGGNKQGRYKGVILSRSNDREMTITS